MAGWSARLIPLGKRKERAPMMNGLMRLCRLLIFAALPVPVAFSAIGQVQGEAAITDTYTEGVPNDPLGRSTPRGMVNGLLSALSENDYSRAAEFLDVSAIDEAIRGNRGQALAKGLRDLLGRRGTVLSSYQ